MLNVLLLLTALNTIALVLLFLRRAPAETNQVQNYFESLRKDLERGERLTREEFAQNREESRSTAGTFGNSLLARMTDIATLQKNQLDTFSNQLSSLTQVNEQKLENLREAVEGRLKSLQTENAAKLDAMREIVDEKLHATLEKRLGEMQTLASGVGDLKKVLANVKTRGTWGEVQLGNLLDQILTPEQFARNVATKQGSRDTVEYALILPGHGDAEVYLPIDAKFPTEDYERLQSAAEDADAVRVEDSAKALENRLKLEGRNIRDKYLDPPRTTDFGILFLPTEGLYAEVLRRPGLFDFLRSEYRVIVTGPTTIAALLNSLQMGFRTLAVEKRASEVWTLLGAVKAEFGKFGDILDKTQEKLRQASDTIEEASKKTRTIERKLKNVQELPAGTMSPAAANEVAQADAYAE